MFSFKRSLIALVGVLVLVGALAALMPLVSRGQGGNPLTRDTRKSFYVTKTSHDGSEALTACAEGYHMASLWEIFDTSNLRYDTQLGATAQDSGSARLLLVACQRAGFARAGAPVTAKLLVSVIAMPGRAQASTIRERSFILIFPGIRPA